MAIDLAFVGAAGGETEQRWTAKDTLLYAVAVGAGHGDPSTELEFTTETRLSDTGFCHRSSASLQDLFCQLLFGRYDSNAPR